MQLGIINPQWDGRVYAVKYFFGAEQKGMHYQANDGKWHILPSL